MICRHLFPSFHYSFKLNILFLSLDNPRVPGYWWGPPVLAVDCQIPSGARARSSLPWGMEPRMEEVVEGGAAPIRSHLLGSSALAWQDFWSSPKSCLPPSEAQCNDKKGASVSSKHGFLSTLIFHFTVFVVIREDKIYNQITTPFLRSKYKKRQHYSL